METNPSMEISSIGIGAFPTEMVWYFMLKLPYLDLLSFCRTDRRATDICQNDHFWHQKYIHDFKEARLTYSSWKQQYDNIRDRLSGILVNGELIIKHRPQPTDDDPRRRYAGKKCKYFTKSALIENLWEFNTFFPTSLPGEHSRSLDNLSSMVKVLSLNQIDISGFSEAKIKFYYYWVNIKRHDICQFLKDFLKQHNLLFTYVPSVQQVSNPFNVQPMSLELRLVE